MPSNGIRTLRIDDPQFRLRLDGHVAVLHISGELDMVGVPAITGILDALQQAEVPDVRLCAADVTFIDCSMLHPMLEARQRLVAQGGSLHVVDPSPCAVRLLELAGQNSLLEPPPASARRSSDRAAACAGSSVDFTSRSRAMQKRALQLCGRCPERQSCRDLADTLGDTTTVLGGENPPARMARWRRQRIR